MTILVDIKKNLGNFKLNVLFEARDEILALLGASGCGKSMTLKCITGIVKPDEGVIVVNGSTLFDSKKGINLTPQKRNVGLLFQNYALFPNMTVEENIMAVLTRVKKAKDAQARFRSLCERFYITGLERHYPAQLSGGQQQRVALARIMASDPSIIMLDEPLSALDSYLRWQLELELIQMLEDFPATTLYVSHNRDEVFRICDRVCAMSAGHAEKVCSTEELFEKPSSLAAAFLSGCKNYSCIETRGQDVVFAKDWGIELLCAERVPANAAYIGVRAHFIAPVRAGEGQNIVPCRVLRVVQDVFSTIIMLLPQGAAPCGNDYAKIRMEIPKEEAKGIREGDTVSVKIQPRDIMLLKR